jgi:hypothetical protein
MLRLGYCILCGDEYPFCELNLPERRWPVDEHYGEWVLKKTSSEQTGPKEG